MMTESTTTLRCRCVYARVSSDAVDVDLARALDDREKTVRLRLRPRERGSVGGVGGENSSRVTVNGTEATAGEAEVTLRRDREGAYVSMDDVVIEGEFDFDLAWDRDVWGRGSGGADADGAWTMSLRETPTRALSRSREAERAMRDESSTMFEVELGVIGTSRGERVFLVSSIALPLQRALPPTRSPRVSVSVGETSAVLPVIDEHTTAVPVKSTKAVARQHRHSTWRTPSLLGGDLESLAILSKMRQRYESMMEIPDEYPMEPMKLSWFEASLRLGIGVGLGAVLGVGLGVGVVVNGFRAMGSGRLSPRSRSRKSSVESIDL